MPSMTVTRTTSQEQYVPAAGPTTPSTSNVDGRTLTVRPSTLSTDDLVKAPPEHRAKMAGVRLGIGSAGDRLNFLERNGVMPAEDKVLTAARYAHNVKIDHKNASNLEFQLNRMRIGEVSLPKQAKPDSMEIRNALDVIPLALPDRNEKHTIPTDKYLMNRLSSGAVEQARHHGL